MPGTQNKALLWINFPLFNGFFNFNPFCRCECLGLHQEQSLNIMANDGECIFSADTLHFLSLALHLEVKYLCTHGCEWVVRSRKLS